MISTIPLYDVTKISAQDLYLTRSARSSPSLIAPSDAPEHLTCKRTHGSNHGSHLQRTAVKDDSNKHVCTPMLNDKEMPKSTHKTTQANQADIDVELAIEATEQLEMTHEDLKSLITEETRRIVCEFFWEEAPTLIVEAS